MALLAIAACAAAVVSGVASALTYSDAEPRLRAWGLTLPFLRPIHETFAFAWVFLGGIAVVHHFLVSDRAGGAGWRTRGMIALWTIAGVGILLSLLASRSTGREYLGYPPVWSAFIYAGWILFAWEYFARAGLARAGRPAYEYMWTVGIVVFLVAYAEGHLYLLEAISRRPVRDIAFQWKSNGALVGSFNQIVYGSMLYVACRIRGDDRPARSPATFVLMWISILNTAANYGHHTYHLPQSHWIHWTAFVVSMLEVVIFAKVGVDFMRLLRPAPAAPRTAATAFQAGATMWTFLLLALAIAISIPPLNAILHGTHVVVAHSMGSMIGIDSMILWMALAWLVQTHADPRRAATAENGARAALPWIHGSFLVFWMTLLLMGIARGWQRYAGAAAPDFSTLTAGLPGLFAVSGAVLAAAILWTLLPWGFAFVAELRRPCATNVR